MSHWDQRKIPAVWTLSPGEREVVVLLAEGLTRTEIAERRGVSIETIKTQVRHALWKTAARNSVQLVALCVAQGLIVLSEEE